MAEPKRYRTIRYMRKEALATLGTDSISPNAQKVLANANPSDPLILLISVTNPAFIEEVLPFSKDNMFKMVEIAEKKAE